MGWCYIGPPRLLAPLCRLYTVLKQRVYHLLREKGVQVMLLIDDHVVCGDG